MSAPVPGRTSADVALYRSLYCRVSDAYGEMLPHGPCAQRSILRDQDVQAHLAGTRLLGYYLVDKDGHADKGIVDVDVPKDRLDDPEAWAEAREKVRAITAVLSRHRIEFYVVPSRRRGWHVYVHANAPVPASLIRRFLRAIVRQARVANVEIFPKQDARGGEDGLGNFVFGPLHGRAAPQGRTVIVDHENGLDPVPDSWEVLAGIKGNSMETLSAVLVTLEEGEKGATPSPSSLPGDGDTLPLELLDAVFERCVELDGLRRNAIEAGRLLPEDNPGEHLTRIRVANLYRTFDGGTERAVREVFSHLEDFDPRETEKQLASLCGAPPPCEELCPAGQCEAIRALGKNSPIAFAYAARRGTRKVPAKSVNSPSMASAPKPASLEFPVDVISGVAGEFAALHSSVLESPIQFFYFAFLTCLGAIVAGRLTLASELYPQVRLFLLLLGESADDRKSTAISKAVDFFKKAIEEFPVCFGVGSAEGLQKRLNKGKNLLLVFDEFKAFVSKCKIESSVLLSCVNTLFESHRYEAHTKHSSILLERVHLSVLADSTIATYQNCWSSQFTDIGFNNRLWLVPGGTSPRFAFPPRIGDDKLFPLRRKLDEILALVEKNPVLDLTPGARGVYASWYERRERGVHSRRLDTYALRLMPLLAINDLKTAVDEEIVLKAITLVDHQLRVRQVLDPIDADNAMAKMEEALRRVLRSRGPLTDRELKQFTNANKAGMWVYNSAKQNLLNGREVAFDKSLKRFFVQPEGERP